MLLKTALLSLLAVAPAALAEITMTDCWLPDTYNATWVPRRDVEGGIAYLRDRWDQQCELAIEPGSPYTSFCYFDKVQIAGGLLHDAIEASIPCGDIADAAQSVVDVCGDTTGTMVRGGASIGNRVVVLPYPFPNSIQGH
ncbi:hypothetical protein BDW62DRAFT_200941 [Aspergillus aurantiobrunneus]